MIIFGILLLIAFVDFVFCDIEINLKFPILYVYTVTARSCARGLPGYIKVSLEQAVLSQPDCDVIMASNYAECATIEMVIDSIPNVIKLDTSKISSKRYASFAKACVRMFDANTGSDDLWITSALRFFSMEDFMVESGRSEMLHVEADNLLYGKFTDLLPAFRTGYKGLAATPLNSNKSFITASVLWIPSLLALQSFNDFLLKLGENLNKEWQGYLNWLRPYGCCKPGGVDPDMNGQGIKPFAINEMSMLAYYHFLYPEKFLLLPVVPTHDYFLHKLWSNLTAFSPIGHEVGPLTGIGIWDPNSWGQYMGGTSAQKGSNLHFTDASHIAGQAIRTNKCVPYEVCSNISISFPLNYDQPLIKADGELNNKVTNNNISTPIEMSNHCYTAPYVRCGEDQLLTPLWNLHVHSKKTQNFRSRRCDCPVT